MPLPSKIRDLYNERLGEVRNMVVTDVQLQNDEELSLKQDKVEVKDKPSEQKPKAE